MPDKLVAKDYKIDKLVSMLNPVNPRQISDDAKSALSEGFYRFGCVEPVIVNLTTGMVVGGHQRVTTASESGIKTLPVVELELTPERELALNLALNKIGGNWDFDKLADLVMDIPIEDVFVTGFSASEIDTIANRYERDIEMLETRSERQDEGMGGSRSGERGAPGVQGEPGQGKCIYDDDDRFQAGGSIDRSDQIRNRLPDEVTPLKGTDANSLSIYFGMFSNKISIASYERWVADLKAESEYGDSPTALGLVVAKRLGLAVTEG